MVSVNLITLLVALLGVAKTSAFLPPHTQHISITRSIICTRHNHVELMAENKDGDIDVEPFLPSLPSPKDVKANILEGTVGERGEQYVIAQFSLFLFIAIGNVPLVGEALVSFLGPTLILAGLFLVYKSAADLENNLSPWPVPAESGRGSLISEGIYSYIRHPMYAGSLFGMTGLSLITDSVTRLLLTSLLYFVLDAKSDYEETKMIETYGTQYTDYQKKVQGKFLPPSMNSIFEFNS